MSDFFKGVTFPWQEVTPSDDAIVQRASLPDRRLSGCDLTYSGYTLTMAAGSMLVCGRQFRHTAAQNWAVTGASSGYARLLLTIDVTKASTEDAFEQISTSIEYATAADGFAALRQDDINNAGIIYQAVICVVSLGAGGITSIVESIVKGSLNASDVGARPSDWLPTLEEIGAQKIIGKGQITGDLNDYEKLRDTICWVNGNSVANSPTTNFAVVETWSNGGGIILQRVTTVSHNIALRVRYNSKWSEWEWLNPPMNIGTEYRLIEKWNGKAVYCKVISCGALVAAGSRKTVSIGQAGITRIVRHCGYAVYGSSAGEAYKGTPVSLPIYGVTGLIGYHAVAAEGLIYIECIEDGTEFTSSYITLWYTKD